MQKSKHELNSGSNQKQANELPELVVNAVNKINRDNLLPLYQQLLESLTSVLEKGELQPGAFFATEALLQSISGMSRSTIRRALEELTRVGRLVRITGKGTFVALPEVQVAVPELKSLTQELTGRGMKPGSLLLDVEWTSIPENIKNEVSFNEKMLCIKRVRTGNGIPLLYSSAYIPKEVGIKENLDFNGSLYDILKEHGKKAENAIHTIKATIIEKKIAKLLGVAPKTAAIFFQRKTYDKDGNFILYEEGVGRGDLYSYTLRMQHYS